MSQNTLKVHDLNEDAEFDENGVEVFDEKALVEEEPSDNDLAEEETVIAGSHTACVGRDSALPW
ncbi:RNA polymerase sigma factor RpoS [Escherichia coli]|nr:RNA polymerase sigma factor RpoS [Escherichia coli]